MSEVPKNSFRENQERRIAAEAQKREEKRAEAQLTLLQEEANNTAEDRQSEERHEEIERHNWAEQAVIGAAQLKATQRANCITATAVIVGALSAIGVILSVIAAREATIEANRAWIGFVQMVDPQSMNPPYVLQKGGGIPIDLKYRNMGREPARDIHAEQQVGLYTLTKPRFAMADLHFPILDCQKYGPHLNTMTVFPGTTEEFSGVPINIAGEDVAGSVLDESGVFYANECLTYRTFGRVHHTGACYYLHMSVATHKPEWGVCATGNTAD